MLIEYDIAIKGNVKVLGSTNTTRTVAVQASNQPSEQDDTKLPEKYPGGKTVGAVRLDKAGGEAELTSTGGGPDSGLSISFTIKCPCCDLGPQAPESTAMAAGPAPSKKSK